MNPAVHCKVVFTQQPPVFVPCSAVSCNPSSRVGHSKVLQLLCPGQLGTGRCSGWQAAQLQVNTSRDFAAAAVALP